MLQDLHKHMDRALAESDQGEGVDGDDFMAKFLADLEVREKTEARRMVEDRRQEGLAAQESHLTD